MKFNLGPKFSDMTKEGQELFITLMLIPFGGLLVIAVSTGILTLFGVKL